MIRELDHSRAQHSSSIEQTETARREANTLRAENHQLRNQLNAQSAELARLTGQQPQTPTPHADQRINSASHINLSNRAELPPIRGAYMGDDNMTGVQYHHDPRNHNDPRGHPSGFSSDRTEYSRDHYPPGYTETSTSKGYFPSQAQTQSSAYLNGLGVNKIKH